MKKKIIVSFFLLLNFQLASSQELKNIQGIVNLGDTALFTNLTALKFVSDNEIYTPTLFILKLPNVINDYWYRVSKNSQYIFSFIGKQYLFIFDKFQTDQILRDSLWCITGDKLCHSVSMERAIDLIHILETNSEERDLWIENKISFENITSASGYYVSRYKNIYFVFLNVTNIDPQSIVNSFNEIHPYTFRTK